MRATPFGWPRGGRNQTLIQVGVRAVARVWDRCHEGRSRAACRTRAARVFPRDLCSIFGYFRPQSGFGSEAMQLSQMWREHLQAGCPAEMRAVHIAGTSMRELDAEITACVSACVTHSLKMDSRIERRLHDISHALEDF